MKAYIDAYGEIGPGSGPVTVEFFSDVDHPLVYSVLPHPNSDPCFFADVESIEEAKSICAEVDADVIGVHAAATVATAGGSIHIEPDPDPHRAAKVTFPDGEVKRYCETDLAYEAVGAYFGVTGCVDQAAPKICDLCREKTPAEIAAGRAEAARAAADFHAAEAPGAPTTP